MLEVLLVGTGGFIGSALRYGVSRFAEAWMPQFPLGTLIVNAVASLLVGTVLGISRSSGIIPKNATLFLTVGLCGGMSTFSTFSAETFLLLKEHDYLGAGSNIALNTVISVACAATGFAFGAWIASTIVQVEQ